MDTQAKISNAGRVPVCQNCKKEFQIKLDDLNFYKKISSAMSTKIPPPTWCPECRMARRLSFANTWNLYWRNCDKCGKKTLSVFPQEKEIIAYCSPCWWGDSWDGTEYGMDYDPARPFLDQVKELLGRTPHMALEADYLTIKNSEYANSIGWSKDCYGVFWADFCDNAYHSSILNKLRWSSDCLRAKDSELCYESVGINKCYETFFSEECDSCVDVGFCRNCYGCIDCLGCVNLRGASYCIFNKKYTKEEYLKKLAELKLDSWKNLYNFEKKFQEFQLTLPRREYTGNPLNENVTGEYVYESRNSKEMYLCSGAENCKYCQFITVPPTRDCWDYSGWGNNSTQIYESNLVGEDSDSICFSAVCLPDCFNLQYCYRIIAGKNDLGCVNLKRKNYCILNKQYQKEEFKKLKDEIIKDMRENPYVDKLGRKFYYGEFFPPEFSSFPYNKSNAMRFLPKTKEQALGSGYFWEHEKIIKYDITISARDLLATIKETEDSILNEIIRCPDCSRGYRIAKGELGLLRKMRLPVPHRCPKCRESARFAKMNRPKFYDRECAKCAKSIKTAFSPDGPEIVYCEKCYQGEFI